MQQGDWQSIRVSARVDEVTAQRLLPQAIYLKACLEGPGQLGRFSESFERYTIHKARDGAAKVAVTRSLGALYRLELLYSGWSWTQFWFRNTGNYWPFVFFPDMSFGGTAFLSGPSVLRTWDSFLFQMCQSCLWGCLDVRFWCGLCGECLVLVRPVSTRLSCPGEGA